MKRGVLVGATHGARDDLGLAVSARAEVPAGKQQNGGLLSPARPAPPGGVRKCRAVSFRACRLGVVLLGVAVPFLSLREGRVLEQDLVEADAEAGGDGLGLLGEGEPRLPLRAGLLNPRLELRVPKTRLL